MSILPHRTSPESMTPAPATGRMSRHVFRAVPSVEWKIRWRVILPASSPNTAPSPATLEAILTEDGISVVLSDRRGETLFEQRMESTVAGTEGAEHRLHEWRGRTQPSNDTPVVRILVATGQPPLVRTTLPELMGLPAGRYDLAEAAPVLSTAANQAS